MSRTIYRLLAGARADRFFWRLDSQRLRILCYHGVCRDSVKGLSWAPDCFVTISAFESQMRYLAANAQVIPLAEAVARLREGTLPSCSVCITFDDGYANNLQFAYPVLDRYALPATIFLTSAYVQSGGFYPFIKLKLIQLSLGEEKARKVLLDYKSSPLDMVLERSDQWWKEIEVGLTESQRETLRPLTIEETGAFSPKLIEFGGHSHTHCIFGNESDSRRREEILTSISAIAGWTGRPVRLFAYPNGQRGDFGPSDKEILRTQGVGAAVTGIAGANGADADLLALRRYPVGMYHDGDGFRAELSGMRSAILRMTQGAK